MGRASLRSGTSGVGSKVWTDGSSQCGVVWVDRVFGVMGVRVVGMVWVSGLIAGCWWYGGFL